MMATTSDQEKARALLQKYRAGLCTPEETERVQRWFEALGEAGALPTPEQTDQAARELSAQVMRAIALEKDSRRKRFNRYLLRPGIAAASVLLLLTACYLLLPAGIFRSYRQLATAYGEKREFTLPDGSTVFLNAGSTLRIPSDYGKKQRALILDGEAFFNVRQDGGHPFIVTTGKVYTAVLGTSFNVKAYTSENSIQVAVQSGEVRVQAETPSGKTTIAASITHNQSLTYHTLSRQYSIHTVDVGPLSAWRNNVLHFEEASIQEIAHTLERQFNVRIKVLGNATPHCRYTIQFKDQPLPGILKVLSGLSGIRYVIRDDQIEIDTKNCN